MLHDDLGVALASRGRIGEAIEHFRKALRIKPDDSPALNNLAWLRATYPESSFRDGAEGRRVGPTGVAIVGWPGTDDL